MNDNYSISIQCELRIVSQIELNLIAMRGNLPIFISIQFNNFAASYPGNPKWKFQNSIKNPGRNPGKFHDFDRDRDSKNRSILAGTGILPGSRSILGHDDYVW